MLCEQYIEASISTKNVLVALECGEGLGLEFIKVCGSVVPGAFILEESEAMTFIHFIMVVSTEQFMILLKLKCFPRKILTIAIGIYLLKVNNRTTRTRWEICSKLIIKKTPLASF